MLSMQKFSSNVIEKCMDRASEEMIVKYVMELADPAAMRPLLQARNHPLVFRHPSFLPWRYILLIFFVELSLDR